MTSEFKFYSGAYAMLKKLSRIYESGLNMRNIENELSFISHLNPSLKREYADNVRSLMLLLNMTMMGINKEKIEKTPDNFSYSGYRSPIDIDKCLVTENQKQRYLKFKEQSICDSPFPDWLSITKNNGNINTAAEYVKKVRNAFLHADFRPKYDDYFFVINIANSGKTNTYFEADILWENYISFTNSYFSNVPELGLTPTFQSIWGNPKYKIENETDLIQFLSQIKMLEIKSSNIPSNLVFKGDNAINTNIAKALKEENNDEFLAYINELYESGVEVVGTIGQMSPLQIENCTSYITNKYGVSLYENIGHSIRKDIVMANVEYTMSHDGTISYCLQHYFHLCLVFHRLCLGIFDKNVISDIRKIARDYHFDSQFLPTLQIVKGYLLTYRLQNKELGPIDYNKVNTDIFEEIGNGIDFNIIKKSENDEQTSIEILRKIEICNVLRNSLAHGHVETVFNSYGSGSKVEHNMYFTNEYKDNDTTTIMCDVNAFDELFESPSFDPQQVEKTRVLKRNIDTANKG